MHVQTSARFRKWSIFAMDLPPHSADPTLQTPSGYGAFFDRVALPRNIDSAFVKPLKSEIDSKKCVKYMECLKNHAASIGGHALDGCGEFLASGKEGTAQALHCAACSCHRNFHRRQEEGQPSLSCLECQHFRMDRAKGEVPFDLSPRSGLFRPSLTASGSRNSDVDDIDASTDFYASSSRVKKRFRTKFSGEQKEKMLYLAEKLGWRIQKQDEVEVDESCSEIGIRRHVFKVWMHNNRNASNKKPKSTSPSSFA